LSLDAPFAALAIVFAADKLRRGGAFNATTAGAKIFKRILPLEMWLS